MVNNFLIELRRRRVYQTIGLYVVGAWVTLQVADLAFESWGIPGAALRLIWIAAFILFPLALIFGWRYDITANGIVRTPSQSGSAAVTLRGADRAVIAGIVLGFIATAISVFMLASNYPQDVASGPAFATVPELNADAIAVLPFRSLGGAEETGVFADGVHDDLLTTLSNVLELKVISRTSVLQYRDTVKNLRQIGGELGVGNILEGGVQHVGSQVRINVQLINAETDEHIWAEKYDREMTIENLFAIQTEIVETIAAELALTLSSEERVRIRRDRTDSIEAFNAFTHGNQLFARQTWESLRAAVLEFAKAVEIDPDYLQARVMLARTYYRLEGTGAETLEYMFDHGQLHIDYAINLDPEDGHALAVLAIYEDAAGNEDVSELFARALAHNPKNVDVLDIYATHLRDNGENLAALEYIDRALDLDPLSTTLWHDKGRAAIALGDFEIGGAAFARIAEIDPQNPYASHGAALATILGGQFAEAAYWGEINAQTDADDPENTSTLAQIYLSLGDMAAGEKNLLESLERGPAEPYPLAVKVEFLTLTERRAEAVDVARSALLNELADRWGSERVLLRAIRDEALTTGNYDEALGWYRRLHPGFFEVDPLVTAPTVQRASDLGGLLLAAGQEEQGRRLLEAAIVDYELEYVRGAANWPMGIAKAEALAQLGQDDAALAELQRVFDDGWRMLWQLDTLHNPSFDGLHDDPRFEAFLGQIRDDMAEQVRNFKGPLR